MRDGFWGNGVPLSVVERRAMRFGGAVVVGFGPGRSAADAAVPGLGGTTLSRSRAFGGEQAVIANEVDPG